MGAPLIGKDERDELARKAAKFKKEGLSVKEIAEKLGISASRANYYTYRESFIVPKKKYRDREANKTHRIVSVLGSPVHSNGAVSSLSMSYFIAGLIEGSHITVSEVSAAISSIKGEK